MPVYRCRIAINENKIIERVIQSGSLSAVKKLVTMEGNFLVDAKKTRTGVSVFSFFGREKFSARDFYSFNKEFLTLLRAGIPVVMAFDGIIRKHEKTFISGVLKSIRNDISEGESIADAFEKYEKIFSPLYIATLRSGEAGGNIPGAIEKYLEYFERARQIRQKIKAALVYPAILTVCSVFVVAFLLIFVLPAITGTFLDAGAQLPFYTLILLKFSSFIRSYFILILVAACLAGWGISYTLKTDKGSHFFDICTLKLPLAGELVIIYTVARFSSSLSTLLAGGMPLNRALYIARGLVRNRFLNTGIRSAVREIEQGKSFAAALEEVNIFPDMALRMIAAGEESGNLDKILGEVSLFYENETEARLSIVASTIEPVLMVLTGFIIGFIMLAMYLPIFQMAGTMG